MARQLSESLCRQGYEMTPDNSYTDNKGFRQCKQCRVVRKARYYQNNKDKVRNRTTIYRYNLTLDEIQQMVLFQGGRCAICELVLKKPYVDHDHQTGEVRGILCCSCNTAIGKLQHDPKILRRAANYLEEV